MKTSIELTMVCAVAILLTYSGFAEAWETAVNGRPTSDMDTALAVAVDPATGSIFVAGRRQTSSTTSQFFVAKFSSAGRKLWQETVEGTADLGVSAGAVAAAVDSNGFVFIAGTIGNTDTAADFVIMKIDGRSSRKRVLWKRIFDSGLGHDDIVNSMTLTSDNGIAIAGAVSTGSGAQNFYLMKFTNDGQDAWPSPQIISGTDSNGLNVATAVGALPNGDIAVTGWLTNAGTNEDFVVGRFDGTTGDRQWLITINNPQINGSDAGTALRVTPTGDIVAGGITQALFAGSNFSVFRFSGTGALLWRTDIDRGFFDAVRTIAVAPNGDVIAGGTLEPPSGPNNSIFFVINFGADGRERWRYESPGTSGFLEARDIAFDGNGNPIVTGQTQQSDRALTTFTVISFNKETGSVLWNGSIVGTAPFTNSGEAVVADIKTDAAIAVGVTQNNRTSFDMTVTSITEGYENWRQAISGRGKRVDRDDAALAMAIDSQRNSVALAGYAQNTGAGLLGTPQEFRVVKLRKNGSVDWKYDFNDSLPHIQNAALAVAVDVSGDFFAAGRTCNTLVSSCFTVVRVDRNGKEKWRSILSGFTPGRDEARAILQDPEDGNVIVAGNVQTASGTAFAVFKLDANSGTILWPQSVATLPLGRANALALTSRGTVAVAGSVQGSFAVLEFDTQSGTIISNGILAGMGEARSAIFDDYEGTVLAGGSQIFGPFGAVMTVAKFAGDGTALWQKNLGQTSGTPVAIALHPETGAIAVGGSLSSNTGSVFTVLLLDSGGSERWRKDDVSGAAESISFAQDDVIAAGQFREDRGTVFAVIALALDKTEDWRRTFSGTADFGLDSAHALAIDEKKAEIFAAGVVTDNPTGPDMFSAGLRLDGSDLPGAPLARHTSSAAVN